MFVLEYRYPPANNIVICLQAYHEWIPIRNNVLAPGVPDLAINRTLEFGDLATFVMLEDRLTARTNAGDVSYTEA